MQGINTVISNNNGELQYIITEMKAGKMSSDEVIYRLSMILASSRTLQILTRPSQTSGAKPVRPSKKEPVPQQVAAVEDDNPEQEDKEIKKQREEQHSFFG